MSTSTSSLSATRAAKPVPAGHHTVTPFLVVDGAADALAFYARAFGAVEQARIVAPDGKILYAATKIGDSIVMLNDEFPQMQAIGPKKRGGTAVTMHLFVENADAAFAQAAAAGAQIVMPLQNMFWGDRYGLVVDPFGHAWSIAMRLQDLTPAELQQAADAACAGQ